MITIEDVAYVRVAVDDLDAQARFLTDFGMQPVRRTDRSLYMRGAGAQPVIHISELPSDDFRQAIGYIAASRADLEVCAESLGAGVTQNDEPGGGHIVRAVDPDGYGVEVVHRPSAEPLPVRPVNGGNSGVDRGRYGRLNTKQRFERGPSQVMRLGHVALLSPDAQGAFDWYARHFNFQVSDSFHAPHDPSKRTVIFARCGLGPRFTDHHTLAIVDARSMGGLPERGFDHSAYEVLDWDDVMLGHDHLSAGGHRHSFGIGRHVAGGMVFDYWRDSAGNKIEHWADGDFINDDYEGSTAPAGTVPFKSWGPEHPADFFELPPMAPAR